MGTQLILPTRDASDTDLVAQSRAGDRTAFEELVARYQSALCALTFSACGNVPRSEDLAQEAFLIAWRNLSDLQEPAKFKPWLLGIARNLVRNAFRSDARDPLRTVEPFPEHIAARNPQTDPAQHAVTAEEQRILWHSLERIPQSYREPLVLYYREEESIERVAQMLDLSEDAVRQRLSRGRKLLQEQLTAFVENSLRLTGPTPAFALGVGTALQQITAASLSTAASTAVKGHLAAKTASTLGFLSIAKIVAGKVFPAAAGTWLMLKITESKRERKFAFVAWLVLWICSLLYTFGLLLLGKYFDSSGYAHAHPKQMTLVVLGVAIAFIAFVIPYTFWMARKQRRIRAEEYALQASSGRSALPGAFEYKSSQRFLGLPLVHIRWDYARSPGQAPAIGWIACGQRAFGILFASGGVAFGAISFGGVSVGLIGFGGFAIGLFAFGGLAVGAVAMGGLAVGYLAFGGGAVAWKAASGGAAIAKYIACGGGAIAAHGNDRRAFTYMQRSAFFRNEWTIFNTLIIFSWLVPGFAIYFFKRFLKRKQSNNTR
jgi:RNA polymerase sigma factor (sigma-70 family)